MQQAALPDTRQPGTDWEQVGERFLKCIEARDFEGLGTGFHPQVRCRLLVPSGLLTPPGVSELTGKFSQWFGSADGFHLESSRVARVGDCLHICYRLRVREEGVWYLVEQQTYSHLEAGSITRFDLLCSGFRPEDATG